MPWTVTLYKPGRPERVFENVPFLGARIELPVDRLSYRMISWEDRQGMIPQFVETYIIFQITKTHAWADYAGLRRTPEFPRHFNPSRLPA